MHKILKLISSEQLFVMCATPCVCVCPWGDQGDQLIDCFPVIYPCALANIWWIFIQLNIKKIGFTKTATVAKHVAHPLYVGEVMSSNLISTPRFN